MRNPERSDGPLTERFQEALRFANEVHSRQVRKHKDVPFIAHLLGVCSIVMEYGGDEDEAIAALLHDAPEDQGGQPMLDEIRAKFGDVVADIVEEASEPLHLGKASWPTRKQAYIEAIATRSQSGCLVTLADKIHNVQSLLMVLELDGDKMWQAFSASKDDSIGFYRRLADAFEERCKEFPELRLMSRRFHGLVELLCEEACVPM
ncbi:MAG: HD domain-containing protein [Fimbriimonadaceae bacterium]|nr:HD domain-containing protein [Fimbriimonadaceae bacterium]